MGPRARRRVVAGLIALAGIAATVGAFTLLVTHSGSTAPTGPRAGGHVVGKTDTRYYANSTKLAFGMTKQQVRRLVGPPTKTVGRCWQYDVNVEYPAKKTRAQFTWDADRVCFDGGRYSESHLEANGQWDYRFRLPKAG